MNKLQKLQADYQAGKITKAEYQAKLAALLTAEDIDQKEHDTAAEYDPADPDDVPSISQNEVNRIITKRTRQELKKVLKAAGITLDPATVNDKNLFEQVAAMVLAGQGKLPSESEVQKQLTDANAKLAKVGDVGSTITRLTLENAVLKMTGKHKPLNPAQVVRALADYSDHIEYDDEGKLIGKSVEKAIRKMAEAEPNLFAAATGEEENDDGSGTGAGFKGKPPGGGAPAASTAAAAKHAKLKSEALSMLGINKEQK
ncbi:MULTISPECIES: hypothetical protein [Pelosinus]|uniref:SHOCT domain-containing protein n=1 Tax=Pelosinus fermentans B4 TaxID=1149862 RepID=I9LHR1_9FIRM|nr:MULTISPECIES: hypothetical protein [Pelosinus]EIW19921.1 hypothetical protein FB4_0172 [Pelosinus fermentans B4]EIW21222.1 hypothetical protein FA11_0949 [Pelosinus fermentans A11]